jgi:hypothetical protein
MGNFENFKTQNVAFFQEESKAHFDKRQRSVESSLTPR